MTYATKTTIAAGNANHILALNLSFILQPCVCVATIVVSDINDRLSPKNAPPTTIATIKGRQDPVCWAMPTATGVSATTVPTDVPIDSEIKQAAINNPGKSILAGMKRSVRLTVASIAPIAPAILAKAPAKTKIHTISMMFSLPAPREKMFIRSFSGSFGVVQIPYAEAIRNATVRGNL